MKITRVILHHANKSNLQNAINLFINTLKNNYGFSPLAQKAIGEDMFLYYRYEENLLYRFTSAIKSAFDASFFQYLNKTYPNRTYKVDHAELVFADITLDERFLAYACGATQQKNTEPYLFAVKPYALLGIYDTPPKIENIVKKYKGSMDSIMVFKECYDKSYNIPVIKSVYSTSIQWQDLP